MHWIGTGLADWPGIGGLAPDWPKIGQFALDWHRIGRLAISIIFQLAIAVIKTFTGTKNQDWLGLDQIGSDWHDRKLLLERKNDFGSALN